MPGPKGGGLPSGGLSFCFGPVLLCAGAKEEPSSAGQGTGHPARRLPGCPACSRSPHSVLPRREVQLAVTERGHFIPKGQIRGSGKKAGLGRKEPPVIARVRREKN